jgi:uncharacterized OB-fold protein
MLEGKCSKCGYRCSGWALRFPRHQTCPKCGNGLDIYEEGHKISTGYSPFTAKEYRIDPNNITPTSPDIEKDSLSKN